MNVAILYYGYFPWCRPIGQLYSTLEKLGHTPYVFAKYMEEEYRNRGSNYETAYIRKTNGFANKLKSSQIPFSIFWKNWIYKMCLEKEIDLLIVKETPLASVSQSVARKLGISVVLDMREVLPILYATEGSRKIPLPSSIQSYLATIYEKIFVKRFDHIFTVTEELRKYVVDNYDVSQNKISVLGNYPEEGFLAGSTKTIVDCHKGRRKKLVFAGVVDKNSGLQDILLAMKELPPEKKPELVVIGKGVHIKRLKEISERNSLDDYVEFRSFVGPNELMSVLSKFDVGICSYEVSSWMNFTMPGKLFEYMASGLPVLSSARIPVERVINRHDCGVIYKSSEPKKLAKIIEEMLDRKDLWEMGNRGKKAVDQDYSYRKSMQTMKTVIDDLVISTVKS